jgi:basic membrane lipoprotein Med (substrate-binding protein (PBP1-ABC) superfamily)
MFIKQSKTELNKPGEVLSYGLESGTVDVVFENNNDVLPKSIIDKVSEVKQMIINGDLKVERYVAE